MKKINRFICALVIAALVVPFAASVPALAYDEIDAVCTAQEWAGIRYLNEYRAENDMEPLAMPVKLQEAAVVRASEIAGGYENTRPDGGDRWSVLTEYDIDYSDAGEYVVTGPEDVFEVIDFTVDEYGTDAAIFDTSYTHLGLGSADAGDGEESFSLLFIRNDGAYTDLNVLTPEHDVFPIGTEIWEMDIVLEATHETLGTCYVPVLDGMCTGLDYTTPGSHTVTVEFAGETTDFEVVYEEYYNDVTQGEWFYPAVNFVTAEGLMTGTGTATFSPNITLERAMVATILHRMEGLPESQHVITFRDVLEDEWYTDAVAWAEETRIVGGYGNGLFGTDDPVTREQLAVFLYRYAELSGEDMTHTGDLTRFTDESRVSDWAREEMSWAVASGLIQGVTDTTLVPGRQASRAECATLIMRFLSI